MIIHHRKIILNALKSIGKPASKKDVFIVSNRLASGASRPKKLEKEWNFLRTNELIRQTPSKKFACV